MSVAGERDMVCSGIVKGYGFCLALQGVLQLPDLQPMKLLDSAEISLCCKGSMPLQCLGLRFLQPMISHPYDSK